MRRTSTAMHPVAAAMAAEIRIIQRHIETIGDDDPNLSDALTSAQGYYLQEWSKLSGSPVDAFVYRA